MGAIGCVHVTLLLLGGLLFALGRPGMTPAVRQALAAPVVTGTVTTTLHLPVVQRAAPRVLIAAAHIDSALSGEADEALMLWNPGPQTAHLAGWRLEANNATATFPISPAEMLLAPGASLWCTGEPAVFRRTFGFSADCEWGADDDPNVLNLEGDRLRLTNGGGTLRLRTPGGQVVDVLAYGDEETIPDGWTGGAAQVYRRGQVPVSGQVWRRKPGPGLTGFLDTNQASDWSGDIADLAWGRQVFYPGRRDLQGGPAPVAAPISVTGQVTVAIGPDGLYAPLLAALERAQQSIDLSLYTFEHPELAQALANAARRGVQVRLLLEGGPTGGVSDLQRWCTSLMAGAGVQVRYMDVMDGAPNGVRPRYRFLHAKYGVIDGKQAFVSTENLTRDSMPVIVGGRTPPGRRGALLLTDAPQAAQAFAELFAWDWQPDIFWDLRPHGPADAPPEGYTPPPPAPADRDAPFAAAVSASGTWRFALDVAPETASRPDAPLRQLLQQAGAGDEVRWVQLYEQKYWGDAFSNPVADPNPRLAELVDAARRGARVRVLLDSFFDDPAGDRSNQATRAYLETVAAAENLDLQVRLGNPAGLGIHAKVALIHVDGAYWSAVGSLNGGEVSHKLNREVVLLVDAPAIYARLAEVFEADWEKSDSPLKRGWNADGADGADHRG